MLQWTRDWGRAQQLAWEVANAFVDQCNQADEVKEGVREWLQALASARVPCTLVSNMSRYGGSKSKLARSCSIRWDNTAWQKVAAAVTSLSTMLLQLCNPSSVSHQDKQSKCCMTCQARCQTLSNHCLQP